MVVGDSSEDRNGANEDGAEEQSGLRESRITSVLPLLTEQAVEISFCNDGIGLRRALTRVVTP